MSTNKIKIGLLGPADTSLGKSVIQNLELQGYSVTVIEDSTQVAPQELIMGLSGESIKIKNYQLSSEPYKQILTGRQKRINRRKKNRKRK